MDSKMKEELYEATVKALLPEDEQKKLSTVDKIKNDSIMANVYRYGDVPDKPGHMIKKPHPLNGKKTVRFIKQEDRLYFNVYDWLKPYKNALYRKMIKSTVKPPAGKRLDHLWMWIDAWQAVINAVTKAVPAIEVVKTWQSGRLF